MVVDAEVNETNKTTLRSEWRGVQKKVWKKEKKDLTEPALLEMDGNRVYQAQGSFRDQSSALKNWPKHCMLRRSEVHYLLAEGEMEIPTDNFSHLYLATRKASWMDTERGGIL